MSEAQTVRLDVQWQGTGFLARSERGGEAIMGKVGESNGLSPMEMLLASVAGCSGVDIVLILEKMRKTVQAFHMHIEGKRRNTHPRVYTHVQIVYHLRGPDLDPQSVERAIRLSLEKYCSAAATVGAHAQIQYAYVLENSAGRFERAPTVLETVGQGETTT